MKVRPDDEREREKKKEKNESTRIFTVFKQINKTNGNKRTVKMY